MPKEINRWAMYPRKTFTASLPESLNMGVTTKANELIETVLKPKYIQPPPQNPQFNYIVDIYGKWYDKAFYFCADYRVAGPHPIGPSFEAKFARMQYAGNLRFHLSYMRYTGQWIQLYADLTVDECIETIRDDPYFSLSFRNAASTSSHHRTHGKRFRMERDITLAMHRNQWQISFVEPTKELINESHLSYESCCLMLQGVCSCSALSWGRARLWRI